MTKEEKELLAKVNIDKARNKTILAGLLIMVSVLTYVIPLMYGNVDLGLIFEILSFIFLLVARSYMAKYDEIYAKRYILCSIISIGLILLYDLILIVPNIIDVSFSSYYYWFGEIFTIFYFVILLTIHRDLSRANNPMKCQNSVDRFYREYQENGEDKNV